MSSTSDEAKYNTGRERKVTAKKQFAGNGKEIATFESLTSMYIYYEYALVMKSVGSIVVWKEKKGRASLIHSIIFQLVKRHIVNPAKRHLPDSRHLPDTLRFHFRLLDW
jgi:hypothetical protein